MASKKKAAPPPELNLTSMMDVVFQLIIFFLLVSNFSSAELPKLNAPIPDESKALTIPDRKKVTVNVIPRKDDPHMAGSVRFGQEDIAPEDYGRLTLLLREEKEINPAIEIDLRADEALQYDQVQPVMTAITNAQISKINLVAKALP